MNDKKRLGKWLLYSLCLAPAAIALGYYWLEYVPSQHEYFMNLRFRTLAMMGENLGTKIERLRSSYAYAIGVRQVRPSVYIAALVPDLTYLSAGCAFSDSQPAEPVESQIQIKIVSGKVQFTNPGKACPAEASLSQIVSGFNQEELFDDVLIAEAGAVVYQRSVSSPRIVTLNDLMKTAAAPNVFPGEGNGRDADAVRTVRLDESEFALLIQPLRIASLGAEHTLQICGLVRSNRLARDARHVPPEFLLVLFTPLLIVTLSSPFLKVLLLTRTGRLAFHDTALVCLFTVVATAMVTLLIVYGFQHWRNERRPEPDLAGFASALNTQIVSDMQRMRGILENFDSKLPPNIGQMKEPDRTDMVTSAAFDKLPEELDPFDFVFWTNADGCQVAKWTTARLATRRFNQTQQESFQNVIANKLWYVEPGKTFTLQTLVSQTTSRLIVVAAMPSKHSDFQAPCRDQQPPGDAHPSNIVAVSMVAQLRSLSSPLVPPDAGFAVFEPNGRVLFHSQSARNLHEILFEEIRDPGPWREAVAMRAERSGAAYYRGRKFQFRVQPVKGVAGINWSIAVFQEIEPLQARIGWAWVEALVLFALSLGLIGIASMVVVLILGMKSGLSWRRQVDFFLACLWPDPERRPVFRRLAWQLAAITLLSTVVVILGSADANRSSVWLVPFCLLMPVIASSFTAWRLWKPESASGSLLTAGGNETAYFACLSLCLVLLAVVPTLGLWSVCEANETRKHVHRWQQDLVESAEARRLQMRADIQSSHALSEDAKQYFMRHIEAAGALDDQNYVDRFWRTMVGGEVARPPATKLAAADPCQSKPERGDLLKLTCLSGTGAPVEVTSTLPHAAGGPDWPPPDRMATGALWGILALILLGAYVWICRTFGRLFLLDFHYCPLPALTSLPSAATLPSHLLVLGLPLAKKDKAVGQWLGYKPPRVNLYTAHLSGWWVEETTEFLQRQLPAPLARGAGVGETVSGAPAVPPRNWVHISNLEAKLGQASDRQIIADLIEKLVTPHPAEDPVRLIVTSVVDPLLHFDSVLSDERKKIYEHPLPEPELQRLAHLLNNFRKVRAPAPNAQRPAWAEGRAGQIVYEECRHHWALLDIGEEVAGSAPPDTPGDVLRQMIAERALALYKLYWSSCTRSEKLLLIQLAQTGFVNPLGLDTLQELIRKGLILPERRPRLMNETFRQFLETVEGPDTVRQWESEAGESSWLMIRNIVLVLLVLGLGVVGVTQAQFMQNTAAAMTAVVTLLAGLSRFLANLAGRRVGPLSESA